MGKTPFATPKKHDFLDEICHPVAKSAGEDIKQLHVWPRAAHIFGPDDGFGPAVCKSPTGGGGGTLMTIG